MAVNQPIPRAQPEGEVCLRSHNSLATSESLIYLLLIVQVTHPVPRNKTNRNLKVERSPKLARVKFAVSHWISLNLCDDISDIDSYKLLQSSIESFGQLQYTFASFDTVHLVQLLQLINARDSEAAHRVCVRDSSSHFVYTSDLIEIFVASSLALLYTALSVYKSVLMNVQLYRECHQFVYN